VGVLAVYPEEPQFRDELRSRRSQNLNIQIIFLFVFHLTPPFAALSAYYSCVVIRVLQVFGSSLAVADLIGSIIFVYSFLDFHVLHRKDSPNVFLFKLAGVIASFTASVGSLFLTAIDRYISIHRPMAYKRIVTKTKAVIAFSVMWTISIVISLLPLLGWNCKRLGTVCSDIFPLIDQKYLMFWIGITSVLVLFIIYAYMFILWKSHHHQARMDLRLAKTLVLILVALIICWGPLLAIMVYDLFGKVNDFIKTVFAFCSMLCLLNSTVNPVIYAMRSKDLRRAFVSTCHVWRGTPSHPRSSSCRSEKIKQKQISSLRGATRLNSNPSRSRQPLLLLLGEEEYLEVKVGAAERSLDGGARRRVEVASHGGR
uniref:Cannabinoid receptor 1 n=1 Tax=Kryptolebias marmoratus TaxID=37003 RepID=A0A3Q3A4V0_KRYMA